VQFTADEQEAVRGVLAGTDSAQAIVAKYAGELGDQLVELVRDAFATGLRWAFLLDGALAVLGAVVSILFVGGSLLKRRNTANASSSTT
jgi:hypothetical protein